MKKGFCRAFAGVLAGLLAASVSACGGRTVSPSAALVFSPAEVQYADTLNAAAEERITITGEALEAFLETIDGIRMDYPYSEFYGTDLLFDAQNADLSVKAHAFSALDENGAISAEHLSAVIKENSAAFLEEQTETALTQPAEAVRDAVSCLITQTGVEMSGRLPGMDLSRIACNLGRLCLLVNEWQDAYVTLTDDMVMCLNPAAAEAIVGAAENAAVRDALMLEAMHIMQFGCSCEKIEGCTRRAGVSFRFGNTEQNGMDWPWFYNGAAALYISLLTGKVPSAYASMANYVRTLDLVSLLQDSIPAGAAEEIAFGSELARLFSLFGGENTEDQFEIVNMMRAIDIIQNTPEDFFTVYCESFDLDPADGNVAADLHYRLRPAICLTLSRVFYKNLAQAALAHPEMTQADLYCLINLFEQALNYHLGLTKNTMGAVNAPFLVQYRMMRTAFFETLVDSGSTAGLDGYFAYAYYAGDHVINASLTWLDPAKQDVVRERSAFFAGETVYQIPEPEELD